MENKKEVLLTEWKRVGNRMMGRFAGHRVIPDGAYCRTSAILWWDRESNILETENSVYYLEPWSDGEPAWLAYVRVKDEFKDREFESRTTVPCAYCRRRMVRSQATVDHVHPISKGGAHHRSNFVISCRSCNEEKADMHVDEYMSRVDTFRASYMTSKNAMLIRKVGRAVMHRS